jgi:hypothetical protein
MNQGWLISQGEKEKRLGNDLLPLPSFLLNLNVRNQSFKT